MKGLRRVVQSKTLHGFLILLVIWELTHQLLHSNIVPNPIATGVVFVRLMSQELLWHMGASLLRIGVAIVIAMLIGIPLGLWTGSSKRADAVFSPVVYVLYPLPKIAFLPVFMLLFGLGNVSKIILVVTIIVFQILLGTRDGVKEIPKELYYAVKALGSDQWTMYRHLIIPAVLPKMISSLRISVGIGLSALFFSENYAASYGIGYFIMDAWAVMKYKEMFAGILALGIMSFLLFKAIDLLEKRLCSWMFISQ
ncbi:MAG: ssuC [Clostridia bacterium]|jgi:NitT/TauT family transport system permease protein|nr:ssuC [Clostridia bacterium]